MTARQLALSAFWSEHPLCQIYQRLHDERAFSLQQLIRFAETLPQHVVDALAEGDADAQSV